MVVFLKGKIMIVTQEMTQPQFYAEFIMTRGKFKPQEFGVDLNREQLTEKIVDEFNGCYRSWTIDELLLHPREAARFCDDIRRKYAYWDLPDDIILRVIITRRKNP